jgi:hypothetical protein
MEDSMLIAVRFREMLDDKWYVWLRTGPNDDFCEHGNEPSGSIKIGEFCNWLSDRPRRHLLHGVTYKLLH